MAIVANIIAEFNPKGFKKAETAFANFRTAVGEAEGAAGKFKAGAGSAFNFVKANAAEFGAAAGAALFAFGVKSVQAFQDTALAAGKFSDAAGIAVEDASRWAEVAGDLGIESTAVEGAILKMNKALADGKPVFGEYGVEIAKTDSGLVDANATFINAITTIGAIKDPTLRAKAAQEAFGKSYGQVAELMEMSAGDLQAALSGVSEAKVIDAKELAAAREFRAALDNLRERVEVVQLSLGKELVESLNDVIAAFEAADEAAKKLGLDGLTQVLDIVNRSLNPLAAIKGAWSDIKGIFGGTEDDAADMSAATDDAAARASYYGARLKGDVAEGAAEAAEKTANLKRATDQAKIAAQQYLAQWDSLKKSLTNKQDWADLQLQFLTLKEKSLEAFYAIQSGADDAKQKQLEYESALASSGLAMIDYAQQVLGLPVEHVTALKVLVDTGQMDLLEQRLAILTRNWTMSVSIAARGGMGYESYDGKLAAGGPALANRTYLVGEEGPELFVPNVSGTVIPSAQTMSMLSSGSRVGLASSANTVNISITTGADPNAVVDAIKRYSRLNGNGWMP